MKTNTQTSGVQRFDGGTETTFNCARASVSRWKTWSRRLMVAWRASATATAILFGWCNLDAQVAPPVTLFHTSTGPIAGGVTVGPDGVIYFSTLQNGANNAKVTALYPNGDVKWTLAPLVGGVSYNMWPLPILEPDDNTLMIGSDAGVFYGLDANTGGQNWSYSVPAATDKRIRSTAAFNLGQSQGSVFFHCNDGYLYALKARNGLFRWRKATGNNGGPPPTVPPNNDHTETWSSSPVIGADGTVYVGSADGKVYAFVATTGANKWPGPVNLGSPIEATIAIGADSWLYVATRRDDAGVGGRLFAINPAKAVVDPSQAIEWSVDVPHTLTPPGVIASPVIDQSGFIYVADFHDIVTKYHPKAAPPPAPPQTAVELRRWTVFGKFCQTPTLNQDGLLLVGTSTDNGGNGPQEKRAIRAFHTDKSGTGTTPYWTVPDVGGQLVGDFLGAPAIICSSAGTTYIADMDMPNGAGRLYKFDSGSTLMAGDWPTFQAGVRRIGKVKAYAYTIIELPPFPDGDPPPLLGNLDPYGRAVGQAKGEFPCAGHNPDHNWPALWRNAMIGYPGLCNGLVRDWFA
jgi:outer membrane protein assembly factor BamB